MMSFVAIATSLVMIAMNNASAGCFQEHLEEAIALNRARLIAYAELSGKRSIPISLQMILGEKMSLIPAAHFDFLAKPYENAGIPLMCQAFVSMTGTPAFQNGLLPPDLNPIPFQKVNTKKLKAQLFQSFKTSGFAGLALAAQSQARSLRNPRFNCMLRHGLESIARIAMLAPVHNKLSLAKSLPPSSDISERLLKFHLHGIGLLHNLDVTAQPLQESGVAIICNDVPHIPLDM